MARIAGFGLGPMTVELVKNFLRRVTWRITLLFSAKLSGCAMGLRSLYAFISASLEEISFPEGRLKVPLWNYSP